MSDLSQLKLFLTQPHPCSYLEKREATTIFVDPRAPLDRTLYSYLSELGFRRSGPHIYKPRCQLCEACVPSRIPLSAFTPNRTQKRILKRNRDIRTVILPDINTEECYQLYERYINVRHRDGDMYPATRDQYRSFLTNEWDCTRHLAFYLGQRLVAIAVTDVLDNGLSAIYTFFDPQELSRSLGVLAILKQIEWGQSQAMAHLYLGYWVRGCPKMDYKINYRPVEILVKSRWIRAN